MGTKGAGSANTKAKNQAMAQRMKAAGVTRTTTRCPMCHALVSLKALPFHLGKCNTGR